jgi:hypothetical protein
MGCQDGVWAESLTVRATEVGEMETKVSSSPELVPNLVSPESSREVPEIDSRIVALSNWGQASRRKIWAKPTILSDEPRDLSEFPADDMAA